MLNYQHRQPYDVRLLLKIRRNTIIIRKILQNPDKIILVQVSYVQKKSQVHGSHNLIITQLMKFAILWLQHKHPRQEPLKRNHQAHQPEMGNLIMHQCFRFVRNFNSMQFPQFHNSTIRISIDFICGNSISLAYIWLKSKASLHLLIASKWWKL